MASTQAQKSLHTRASNLSKESIPKCAACQFGKQTSRPVPGKVTKMIPERQGILSADVNHPGERVFIDHFITSTRGRKQSGYGIKKNNLSLYARENSYCGGCIFVDAATGYTEIEPQSFLSAEETIKAVNAFELNCLDHGIMVQEYRSDNGSAFTSKSFKENLASKQQTAKYSGAGSHHQNGRAERAIRTIMASARTMMLHASIHWGELQDSTLWPFAVKHAVYIYNRLPKLDTGLSTIDLWSRSRFALSKLLTLSTWGCPCYILQKKLADGKKLGRWQPRSERCQYLGVSPNHASSVPLVLNPRTGSVTPQWNLTCDNWFATISNTIEDLPDLNSSEWSSLFGAATHHFPEEEDDMDQPNGETISQTPTMFPRQVQSPTPIPITTTSSENTTTTVTANGETNTN